MANVTVIARPGVLKTDSVTVTFDAVVDETHTFTNTVTDHAVEKGVNISDHNRPEPDKLTFHAYFSDTPLSNQSATQAVRSGSFTFQTTSAFDAGAIGAIDGYAQTQWKALKDLRDSGALLKIMSTLGNYENMVVESITVPRNAKTYDGLECNISFKQIKIVTNALTRVVTTTPAATKKKSTGSATTKDATVEKSTAAAWADDGAKSGNKSVAGFSKLMGGVP